MKRLLLVLVLILFGILSACGAMDEEPDPSYIEEIELDDRIYFDWTTMTYTSGLSTLDIIYNTSNLSDDFLLLREKASYDDLSVDQQNAYVQTLLALHGLDELTAFDLGDIPDTELSDITTYASDTTIKITATEAFTYKSIQTEVIELQDSNVGRITREEYIEYRLGRDLTPDEEVALNTIQHWIIRLNNEIGLSYRIERDSLQELINHIQTNIDDAFTDEDDVLQIGYDIIQTLHDTK